MNTNAFNDEPNDSVWNLMGKAKAVEVSPFFARNVLREIRLAQSQPPTLARPVPGLLRRWRLALTACAAVCIVMTTASVLIQDHESALALRSRDADVVSHLDELLAYSDSSVWLTQPGY